MQMEQSSWSVVTEGQHSMAHDEVHERFPKCSISAVSSAQGERGRPPPDRPRAREGVSPLLRPAWRWVTETGSAAVTGPQPGVGDTDRRIHSIFIHRLMVVTLLCRARDVLAWPPLRQEEKWGRQNVSVVVGLEQITPPLTEQL